MPRRPPPSDHPPTATAARPIIVLDHSSLRDKDGALSAAIGRARALAKPLVLPDMSLLETVCAGKWEKTFELNCKTLARHLDIVAYAPPPATLRELEKASAAPCGDFIDPAVTHLVRLLIAQVVAGGGPDLDEFRRNVPQLQTDIVGVQDPPALREFLLSLGKAVNSSGGLDEQRRSSLRKACKEGADRTPLREFLAEAFTQKDVRQTLEKAGYGKETAIALSRLRSVTALSFLVLAVVAADWKYSGGLDNLSEEKVMNAWRDHEYILTALLHPDSEFVSGDGPALYLFRDAQDIAAKIWPEER